MPTSVAHRNSAAVTFFGAAGEVTGSCALVEFAGKRVLIDCGLIQGSPADELRNQDPLPFDAKSLDAAIVTHAHIDHCGRLPLLSRDGYTGPIFATKPTCELLEPVMYGSVSVQHIRFHEAQVRSARSPAGWSVADNEPPVIAMPPLFGNTDVASTLTMLRPVAYGQVTEITPGISFRLLDAGHVIGSAMIELTVGTGASARRIIFSGDLGSSQQMLLPYPKPPAGDTPIEMLVMESTYGNKSHPHPRETLDKLASIIRHAAKKRERLLIPTFTLGRAQNLLFRLGELSREGRLGLPVYLDSKMAMKSTETYTRHAEVLQPEVAARVHAGDSPLHFEELCYISNREDSKKLNRLRRGGIIIAGAGFCHGGPIVHHLIHGLWREDCRVLLIGYSPEGSPAHAMASGARTVRLNDQEVEVHAKIERMRGFSGHADGKDLMDFVAAMSPRPTRLVLNHGEDEARNELAAKLNAAHGIAVFKPVRGEQITL